MARRSPSPRRRSCARDRHEVGEDAAKLGLHVYVYQAALVGVLDEQAWRDLIKEIISTIGMTPFADPACWTWPVTKDGPNGFIIAQPLTESFLAVDVWPDHGGAYLFLSSCKPYWIDCVKSVVKRFGLEVGEQFNNKLALMPP